MAATFVQLRNVAGARRVGDLLYELVRLDSSAARAYSAAIARATSPTLRQMFHEFREDHVRHVRVLRRCLVDLAREPPGGLELYAFIPENESRIAQLANDIALVRALLVNELETFRTYIHALRCQELSAPLATKLHEHFDDEQRHRTWLARELGQMQMD